MMSNGIKPVLLALLFLPLLASASAAEEGAKTDGDLSGEITVKGIGVDIDNESFKHGKYTGISDRGLLLSGSAELSYRTKGGYFLNFRANDALLENKRFLADGGRFRDYRFYLGYDEFSHLISNNSKTPLVGAGDNTLRLPSGFVRGSATTNLTNLTANLKDIRLELRRKKLSMGFSKRLSSGLDASISLEREKKEGTKSIGGALGINGGNTRGIVLPEPVDYTTDELKAVVAYAGEKSNAKFEYYLSKFTDGYDSVRWENPFSVANYPNAARTSLPPDNLHQRFSLSGGVKLPFNARLSAVAEYGMMEQDENLLPYSNNPSSTVTVAPRSRAGARIDTRHLTLNLSAKPAKKLSLNLKYRYYSTVNRTPRDLFRYVKNDTAGAQAALTDAHALYNMPFDYAQRQLKFDGSYYLFKGTVLKAGYDREVIDREFREIDKTRESTYRAALQSNYLSAASIGLNYSFSNRRGDTTYDQSSVFNDMHTTEYINSISTTTLRFDNHPLMRKFDIADRKKTKYGSNITLFPSRDLTVGVYQNYSNEDYASSEFGLKYRKNQSYTIDAAYAPVKDASLYAFYSYESIKSQQESRSYSSASKATQAFDPTRNWWANHNDIIDTIGVGAKVGFMENRLTINADYTLSGSTSSIKFAAGSALTAQDMPDLKTELQTFNLAGKYRMNGNLSVGAGYTYENYESDDWQVDNFNPGSSTIANVITLSGPVEDYESHQAMVFLTYYFGGSQN